MAKFTAERTNEFTQTMTRGTLLTDGERLPAINQNNTIEGVIVDIDRIQIECRKTSELIDKFIFTIRVDSEDDENMHIHLRTNCRITGKKFEYKDGSVKYSKLVRFLQALEIVPTKINEKDSFQFDLTQLIGEPVSFKLYKENGFGTPNEDSLLFLADFYVDDEDSGEE
ncbi:MAG: hypothetical protein AAGH46_03430 [Bacteroidota bacterium]